MKSVLRRRLHKHYENNFVFRFRFGTTRLSGQGSPSLFIMENVEEILQALFIGIAVASVLLQTCRNSEAIDLFNECLVLLNKYSSKLQKDKLVELYALVCYRLFKLYCLVGDFKNAIQRGKNALLVYHKTGKREREAVLLDEMGDVYLSTGEQGKAKGTLLVNLGDYSVALCEYANAMDYFEKALITWKETDDKMKEGGTLQQKDKLNRSRRNALIYHRLFDLHCLVGDCKNAILSGEKAFPLYKESGDIESAAALLDKIGNLYQFTGEQMKAKERYEEALEYYLKYLAISKETGNRTEEGNAHCCLGNLYRKTEEYQEAKQHYEEAIAILEETGEMKGQGVAYGELGKVYSILREFQKAKTLQQKALDISVKVGDKDGEIIDYRSLADVHTSLGETDKAKHCYQKALAISKEVGNRKAEAFTYSDLGGVYRDLNDFINAEIFCKKACETYKEIGDLENEGSENSDLGELYRFVGKFDEAIKCQERALFIKKQIGDRRGEGGTYCNLGTVYQSLGDYSKAKECHEKALAISKETNHLRGQGVDYGNLGTVCQHIGDYDTAYKYYKKALEINIRTGHSEGITAAYDYLGVVCQHRGEYVKAEKFWLRALATSKEIGDRTKEANILANLGNIQTMIGEPEKAKELYEEALQISKEEGDIMKEAMMNCNLGTVYHSLGDMTMAKKFLEKSLDIRKRIGSKDGEGIVLGNLGILHTLLGEYAKARKHFEQALEIATQTVDKNGEMEINNNLGSLHLSQNELQKALEFFKTALQICEQMGDVHGKSRAYCNVAVVYMASQDKSKALSYLSASIKSLEEMRVSIGESEYYKIGFADQNTAPYRLMVTVLLKLKCVNKALSISELARARTLAELMATTYSRKDLPGFDSNRWIDFTNVIQNNSSTCLSFCFVQEILLCWIVRAGRVEVVTIKNLTADIRPQDASIQDWLESLANQCYRKFLLLQGERCEDRSFIWDENTAPRSRSKVEEGVSASQVTDKEEEGEKEPRALKDLYSIIIAPVHKFLEGSEIIIVPDRSLYRIPFAALMDESGSYLSEKFRIRFIPSLTTLKLIQESPANYHSQTGVLIVGDPEVGLPESCPPLPCAREEAEMIGRLLHVRPLTGKQATKQAVLQKIHSVSLIHIAAHGNADRGDIALAPAQHIKGKPKKEDFVLTMSDISKVQLRAKLVVLSCCHSGRGQIKAEGVVGIARSFLGSGARLVLVSMWAVDDSATMEFMKQFYGHLVRGKSAGESLHETMKWMRGNPQYSEVRKWAPFMLIGDDVSFNFEK
ncbi:uncharacterized protein LOC144654161 [Oculina patagonica]